MGKILSICILLLAIITNAQADCREVDVWGASNWRRQGFLWKPEGEHTQKPTIIFKKRQDKVELRSPSKRKIKSYPLWSVGELGAIYRELRLTAAQLEAKYGKPLYVRGILNSRCKDYIIKEPTERSDGLVQIPNQGE